MNQPNLICTNTEPPPFTALKINLDEVMSSAHRPILQTHKTNHLGGGGQIKITSAIELNPREFEDLDDSNRTE